MEGNFETKETPNLRLSEPTAAVKESYLAAVKEFGDAKEWSEEEVGEIENDFDAWIRKLKDEDLGKRHTQEDWVPQSTFWLLEGDKYIGSIRLRKELNEKLKRIGGNIGYAVRPSERKKGYATEMLNMALQKAIEAGLSEVLITCNEDNVASQKVIEANGGELLESNVSIEEHPVPIRRYRIVLESPTKK